MTPEQQRSTDEGLHQVADMPGEDTYGVGCGAENRFECWCVDCRDSVQWEDREAYEATMDKTFPLDYFAGTEWMRDAR